MLRHFPVHFFVLFFGHFHFKLSSHERSNVRGTNILFYLFITPYQRYNRYKIEILVIKSILENCNLHVVHHGNVKSIKITLLRLIRQWSPIVFFCYLRCRGVQRVNRKLSNKKNTNTWDIKHALMAPERQSHS